MLYCPWCDADIPAEPFCSDCGHPVALKAQPGVRLMLDTGVINEKIVETAQRRLIWTVRQQHVDHIRDGVAESTRVGGEFARQERVRMKDQSEDLKERFDAYVAAAEEGRYAPSEYR